MSAMRASLEADGRLPEGDGSLEKAPMNTQSELDRIIHDWLDDRVVEPRPSGLDAVLDRLTTTPQHRRRWLERWLPRGMGATRSARARGGPEGHPTTQGGTRSCSARQGSSARSSSWCSARCWCYRPIVPARRSARQPGQRSTYVVAQDGSGDFVYRHRGGRGSGRRRHHHGQARHATSRRSRSPRTSRWPVTARATRSSSRTRPTARWPIGRSSGDSDGRSAPHFTLLVEGL